MLKVLLILSLLVVPGWSFVQNDSQSAQSGAAAGQPEQGSDSRADSSASGNRLVPGAKGANEIGAPVDPRTYVLGPEDVISVRVWREPDLSGQLIVRPDGMISLPLVNEVRAAGHTPESLSKVIADGLSKYMTHPEVNVAVQQVRSKKYFVEGEVARPGSYPLSVPTTVLEALITAGGFQEFANKKKIVVMRGTERFKFNYNEVIKGKKLDQNIRLESGDVVIVP